jgi:hypothetical protein
MTLMKTVLIVCLLASHAFADDTLSGVYEVKFEQAGSTCQADPTKLDKGKLAITVKKTGVSITLDGRYEMTGNAPKDGAISAKTTKPIGTSVGGLSARYSVTGKVDAGTLQVALTAQYVRQDNNKPYCAQTWNATGPRTGDVPKAKK